MPPQNPYPKHQAGYWLETQRWLRMRGLHNIGADIKIKRGKYVLLLDGEEVSETNHNLIV